MSDFAATVTAWARESEARLQATRNRAIELLADEMMRTKEQGGRVPVDKAHLSRSLLADTSAMPKISDAIPTGTNVGLVTAKLPLDQVVYLGYTMVYARRQNYGFVGSDSKGRVYNQAGNYFVEGAIAQWPQFVEKAARELQAQVEGMK